VNILTQTWDEAVAFFHQVAGLHDSTVEEIRVPSDFGSCILVLTDVYRHTVQDGFVVTYNKLYVEMAEATVKTNVKTVELLEYDIVDAELMPGLLWISTMAGSMAVQFREIRFLLSDEGLQTRLQGCEP